MNYKVWYKKFWDKDEALEVHCAAYQEWVLVKEVEAEELEQVFCMMQGDVWSPNGEARDFIRSLGLTHTSMCVGDFIETPKGEFYRVESCGFELYNALPNHEKISRW